MNFSRWSFQGWVKITILNLKSGPLWLTCRPPSISGPWSFMFSSHQVLWRSRVKWIDLVKVVAKECRATKLNQIRNSSDCSEVYFLHSCNNIIPRGRNWFLQNSSMLSSLVLRWSAGCRYLSAFPIDILWYLYSPRGAECQSCFGTDVMKCSAGRFNTEDLPLHLQAQMPHSFSLPRRMIGCSLAGLMLWDVGPTWSVLSPGAVWSVSGWQALASVSFWLLFIRDVFSGRIPVACAVGSLSL